MKKFFKLALQSSGFVALFSLALTGVSLNAADAEAKDTKSESSGRWNRDDRDSRDASPYSQEEKARFKEKMSERLAEWQAKPESLLSSFDKIKGDAAAIAPKTLTEISALTDDSVRILEIFKFLKAGTAIADTEKALFKKTIQELIKDTKTQGAQVRELLAEIALNKNFTAMEAEETRQAFREIHSDDFDQHRDELKKRIRELKNDLRRAEDRIDELRDEKKKLKRELKEDDKDDKKGRKHKRDKDDHNEKGKGKKNKHSKRKNDDKEEKKGRKHKRNQKYKNDRKNDRKEKKGDDKRD